MINQTMQQTLFHIEKLKSVVNVGRSSAYHIYTSPGCALGQLGEITEPANQDPANEPTFEPETIARSFKKGPLAWINQVFAAVRSKQ